MSRDANAALADCQSWVALPDPNEAAHVLAAEVTVLRQALLAAVDEHAHVDEQDIDSPDSAATYRLCRGCLVDVSDRACPELAAIADALGIDLAGARHHEADAIRARLTSEEDR